MPEPFRSLASIFAQRDAPPVRERIAEDRLEAAFDHKLAPTPSAPVPAPLTDARIVDLLDTFVAELARLRARAAERLEEQAEAVLEDLARRVLARELATAPPVLESLLAESLADFGSSTGIVVRVCASDAERLHARWPVEVDAGLGPGDFVVEVDDGRYDAALQTRLEAMLASHRVAL